MNITARTFLIEMYIQFFEKRTGFDVFAEENGIPEDRAMELLGLGRMLYEETASQRKPVDTLSSHTETQ